MTVEPALTKQETVHIAHGEFHPNKVDEHKESSPENTDNIVFKGTIGKYWILSVPYKKERAGKLLNIKGVYWNKREKAYFVFRHINVKVKIEAMLGKEIFPAEYYNAAAMVKNNQTILELWPFEQDKRWMLLKLPPVPFLIEQVKRWQGSRYSKANKAYVVNATPDALENIKALAQQLSIELSVKLPLHYLKKKKK